MMFISMQLFTLPPQQPSLRLRICLSLLIFYAMEFGPTLLTLRSLAMQVRSDTTPCITLVTLLLALPFGRSTDTFTRNLDQSEHKTSKPASPVHAKDLQLLSTGLRSASKRRTHGGDVGVDPLIRTAKHIKGKGFAPEEPQLTSSVPILAGSGTSATCSSGAIYFLLQHPEWTSRLLRELRGTFKSEAEL